MYAVFLFCLFTTHAALNEGSEIFKSAAKAAHENASEAVQESFKKELLTVPFPEGIADEAIQKSFRRESVTEDEQAALHHCASGIFKGYWLSVPFPEGIADEAVQKSFQREQAAKALHGNANGAVQETFENELNAVKRNGKGTLDAVEQSTLSDNRNAVKRDGKGTLDAVEQSTLSDNRNNMKRAGKGTSDAVEQSTSDNRNASKLKAPIWKLYVRESRNALVMTCSLHLLLVVIFLLRIIHDQCQKKMLVISWKTTVLLSMMITLLTAAIHFTEEEEINIILDWLYLLMVMIFIAVNKCIEYCFIKKQQKRFEANWSCDKNCSVKIKNLVQSINESKCLNSNPKKHFFKKGLEIQVIVPQQI